MFRPPSILLRRPLLKPSRLNSPTSLRAAYVHSEPASFNPRFQRKVTGWTSPWKLLIGFTPVFTFGLGTWQIYRLQWKLKLIEELEDQISKPPMDLPRIINTGALPDFEWRRVTVKGIWDHAHSVLIGPKVKDNEGGYNLVTPLKRSDASTIIVDRGFVKKDRAEAARENSDPETRIDGEVEVTGMLRLQPKSNSFTPDNQPEKGLWYWPDIPQLVEHAGGSYAGVQPVLVEALDHRDIGQHLADMKRGVPIGRPPKVDLRNEHTTYAVIWFVPVIS
ncbi:surf-like protein [Tulasnella sp. 427]|nr:surf-like protein [Tulasnella sp. 427]